MQVKRLESAISKESVPVTDSNNKRDREESEDGDFKLKIRAIDDLRGLSVKQLREEALVRGVSVNGSKKELLQRLCDDPQTNSHNVVEKGICFFINFWVFV